MADFGAAERWAAVGNYGSRQGAAVNLIVAHHTACDLAAALLRFQTYGTQVSAHLIVDADGSLYQCVDLVMAAYHAGDYAVNLRSVGVEFVSGYPGAPGYDVFTDAQYATGRTVFAAIAASFGFELILGDTVRPHHDFTVTTCPGALDLGQLIQEGDMPLDPNDPVVKDLSQKVEYILEMLQDGTLAASGGVPWIAAKLAEIEAKIGTSSGGSVDPALVASIDALTAKLDAIYK